MKTLMCVVVFLAMAAGPASATTEEFEEKVTHHMVANGDVNLHCVSLGEGPVVLMLHGFPDYWYTWREQMESLAVDFQVVAMDLRGYNRSDRPKGLQNYAMPILISDVVAVIREFSEDPVVLVGHDWGGAIAWNVAMFRPEVVERLIICNLPHPRGMGRELRNNAQQQENSAYARNFQKEDAHQQLTAEGLAGWVTDEAARPKYVEAFQRSDFEAMLNYYKVNYPRSTSGSSDASSPPINYPPVRCPVLMIHGLDDQALLASGLNDTWEWLEKDLTLVTVPGAGHFVQQDAADMVTRSMEMWLHR